MTRFEVFLVFLTFFHVSCGIIPLEDTLRPSSIFFKFLGIPILDCKNGRECFNAFIRARPNIRLRIVTNSILDRWTGKYHTRNELENQRFVLEEGFK